MRRLIKISPEQDIIDYMKSRRKPSATAFILDDKKIQVMLNALDRQVPKKPLFKEYSGTGEEMAACQCGSYSIISEYGCRKISVETADSEFYGRMNNDIT